MEVNGLRIKCNFHQDSTKRKRPQTTEEILLQISTALLIDENSNTITKILFLNGHTNYILLDRRDNKCDALEDLHRFVYDKNGNDIQPHLDAVP